MTDKDLTNSVSDASNVSASHPVFTLDDSRRLTGKNFFMDRPGAVIDAFVEGVDKQQVVDVWLAQLAPLLSAVDWQAEQRIYRIFEDGVSLGFSAPMDALYAATEINEAAWALTVEQLLNSKTVSEITLTELSKTLLNTLEAERNPKLLAIMQAAEQHKVDCLVDDDFVSLGYGRSAEVWPVQKLPDPKQLDWSHYKTIPMALVTGTNGKSTSVRLTSHIMQQAGLRCGVTSTDFIRVGDTIIDKGDYSGPGGARLLLRHPETEVAVLEVARGGLLRRGLPIPQVNAALVTNVASDHLGQYGINTVAALTAVKMLVAKGVAKDGTLVLNADDANLVTFVKQFAAQEKNYLAPVCISDGDSSEDGITVQPAALPAKITWFSLDENNPVIAQAKSKGQAVCFVRDQQIIYVSADGTENQIVAVNDIPMTLQGAAIHNIQNALGAVALSTALDVDASAIKSALMSFNSNAADNPGRGNLFSYHGAQVMLDFAHNVHSMDAMATTLKNMPASRKLLLLCLPGDRSDEEARAMTLSAMAMNPDGVWVCELPPYLRGRALGDMPAIIAAAVRETGLAQAAIQQADSPLAGFSDILEQLQADDLVFVMALSQRDDMAALLSR
ncbi:Mur ligase family protein [Leucothrix mucor]|uniref:Mur ligase family protein n=1 Tax=Leucothrix mucor TaxID=45248 RepID=UPI0003B34971|nr:Mur ligase family protein [Leucothrix mucor]